MNFSHILQFLTYIVSWLLLSASGLWFFFTLRNMLFDLGVLLQLNPWALRGIDRWGIFVFGMIWIVVIFFLEGYLRTAIDKNKLWIRLRQVVLILGGVAILLQGSQWVIGFVA